MITWRQEKKIRCKKLREDSTNIMAVEQPLYSKKDSTIDREEMCLIILKKLQLSCKTEKEANA